MIEFAYYLKRCYCCGGEADLVKRQGGWTVDCQASDPWYCARNEIPFCPMMAATPLFPTMEEAVDAWNKRPLEDKFEADNLKLITVMGQYADDSNWSSEAISWQMTGRLLGSNAVEEEVEIVATMDDDVVWSAEGAGYDLAQDVLREIGLWGEE